MKKNIRLALMVLFALVSSVVGAQSMLPIQGTAPNYYITYTIQPKESLSAISRTFDVSVGDIMRINGMHADSKLVLGQQIKIPLTAKNVKQSKDGDAIALVHVVQKGETLYRISQNHNKVPVDLLKQWNKTGDIPIEIGQEIIIGYLYPKGQVNLPVIATESPRVPAPKKEPVKQAPETKPAETEQQPVANNTPAAETQPVTQPAPQPKTEPAAAPKQNTKQVDFSNVSEEGYFSPAFGKEVEGRDLKNASGMASTFKTASGWADKKYYILMNDIPPGSIVKVSAAGKTIYAKVLWSMGEMKENEGLQYRISNASASALGISEAKFEVSVVYYE
ncbi:LysM peptidoglycan-binding domain-containing protein [Foetidibacter luteolus]|uniref:LysM peptidoglycan-binding domain-containing protein n=1 Tax=Foetidibacter luteolus TaxID=2608880 RepID=UPI001A98C847|nr:LysM domain-containing protein [Foetidibacter luteolus]